MLEWALVGIMDQQATYANIKVCCQVLLVVNGCYIFGITVWLIVEKINNYPKEEKSLFY